MIGALNSPAILTAVIPVYLTVLVGFVARKSGLLRTEVDAGLTDLAVRLLLPSLILDKLLASELVRQPAVLGWAAACGFGGVATGIGLGYAGGCLIDLRKGEGLRTFALTSGLQNYGFIAVPVLAAVFPGNGVMGVLFLHNLGVELALWSIGLTMLQGHIGGIGRALLTGPIVAVVAGIAMIYTGIDRLLPAAVQTTLAGLGAGAIPLSLLLVGTTMADLAAYDRPDLRIGLASVVLRLGIIASLLVAAARFLPLPVELKQVMVVQAAMPAAVFPIVMARHYGGSPGVAIQVAVATGAAGLLTIPLVVALAAKWVIG